MKTMTTMTTASNITARTQFLQVESNIYAYRRFGYGTGRPLLFLQHFMGTLDNWDPAVTDALASGREVILFDNAGIGRSTGEVPHTVQGMAMHALAFLDGLGVTTCDVLGFSLGGMVAQQIAQDRPPILRRMILAGTAPRGGEDIMHLEKPSLARHLEDPRLQGYSVLSKIFFAPTESSQAAGTAFIERLTQRKEDLDPPSGSEVAQAQMTSFRNWEAIHGNAVRGSEVHPTANPRRERHLRRVVSSNPPAPYRAASGGRGFAFCRQAPTSAQLPLPFTSGLRVVDDGIPVNVTCSW